MPVFQPQTFGKMFRDLKSHAVPIRALKNQQSLQRNQVAVISLTVAHIEVVSLYQQMIAQSSRINMSLSDLCIYCYLHDNQL